MGRLTTLPGALRGATQSGRRAGYQTGDRTMTSATYQAIDSLTGSLIDLPLAGIRAVDRADLGVSWISVDGDDTHYRVLGEARMLRREIVDAACAAINSGEHEADACAMLGTIVDLTG